MRVGVLFSGGKDSTFSAYIATLFGWDVCCLLSLKSKNPTSFMFHTPNIDLVTYQAEAMELPLLIEETLGEKEEELADLKRLLRKAQRKYKLDGIVVGALYSDYQQERVNRICYELGLKTFAPLWHVSQEYLVREMLDLGFEILFSSIAAYGLGKEWLGKKLDDRLYQRLLQLHNQYGLHVAGEGGEYETFVLDCPLFKKKVVVQDAHVVMQSEEVGTYVIEKIDLVEKD